MHAVPGMNRRAHYAHPSLLVATLMLATLPWRSVKGTHGPPCVCAFIRKNEVMGATGWAGTGVRFKLGSGERSLVGARYAVTVAPPQGSVDSRDLCSVRFVLPDVS